MSLTVLSDGQIQMLLEGLDKADTDVFRLDLKSALHAYSTGQQMDGGPSIEQPDRTVMFSKRNGATTVFMPACAATGHGVKVVTLTSANGGPSHPTIRPTGSITLYSPAGEPMALLHAKTLTAFRTALSSSCLLEKRRTVKTLTVFGCGLQAYWHIRLALRARGHTIRHVNIINRQFSENAKHIMKKFYAIPAAVKQKEGWESTKFSILTPSFGDFNRIEAENIVDADVIYCCTPSTKELFDAEVLTNRDARRKGRLIVAIGSYTPEMRELPRDLLHRAVRTHDSGHRHFHKHAVEGGVVIVDTIDGALKDAGEIIDAGLNPRQLVELGELVMIQQIAKEEEEALAHASQSSETSSLVESFDGLKPFSASNSSAMSTLYTDDSSTSSHKRTHSRSSSTSASGHRRSSSGFASSIGNAFRRPSRSPDTRQQQQPQQQQQQQRPEMARRASSSLAPASSPSRSSNSINVINNNNKKGGDGSDASNNSKKKETHLARWLNDGNVIYKSVGMGLMDLVVAQQVVKVAQQNGFGTEIEHFSSPAPAPIPASGAELAAGARAGVEAGPGDGASSS